MTTNTSLFKSSKFMRVPSFLFTTYNKTAMGGATAILPYWYLTIGSFRICSDDFHPPMAVWWFTPFSLTSPPPCEILSLLPLLFLFSPSPLHLPPFLLPWCHSNSLSLLLSLLLVLPLLPLTIISSSLSFRWFPFLVLSPQAPPSLTWIRGLSPFLFFGFFSKLVH